MMKLQNEIERANYTAKGKIDDTNNLFREKVNKGTE